MKRLTNKARVLVADGAHGLILRNDGDAALPNLTFVRGYEVDNPATHEQGSDRPGRSNDGLGRRSAMEQTDWHQMTEDRFIQQLAAQMDKDLLAGEFHEFVVVAPATALGEYRKAASAALTRATVLEIDKDLTGHTVDDIRAILVRSFELANAAH